MIKTIFIPAHFKPIIKDVFENVPTGETSLPRLLLDTEKVSGGGIYGFGSGFSFTEGVLICIEIK